MSVPELRVVYTRKAAQQLTDILVYTDQQWGKAQRLEYARLLGRTIRSLVENPTMGRRRNELLKDLRSHPVVSHIIYYWHRDDAIVVARILHVGMDPRHDLLSERSEGEGSGS
jgi:toxin ParE1/3/4